MRLCITRKDQLLLYVRREEYVAKSCVIHALKIEFTLLDKRNELMFLVPTGYAAEDIRRRTVYIAVSISTCNVKSLSTNVNAIWTHQSSLIIDVLSMIPLGLLAIIDKQLYKAQNAIVFLISLFDNLPLVILIGDFYQFTPLSDHALWNLHYTENKIYKKVLKDNF